MEPRQLHHLTSETDFLWSLFWKKVSYVVCVCLCLCLCVYLSVFSSIWSLSSLCVHSRGSTPLTREIIVFSCRSFSVFSPIWHHQLYPPLFKYLAIPAEEAWYWEPSRNFLSHLKYKYLASDNGIFEQNIFDLLSCQKGQTADVNCEKYQIGKKSRDCIKMTNWPQAGRVVHIPGLLVQFCGN